MSTWQRAIVGVALFLAGLAAGGYPVRGERRPEPTLTRTEQAPARRWEATVYVPLEDNDGKRFAREVWEKALNLLIAEFGGATLGAEQQGCWLDAKKQIRRDPIQLVIVSFAPGRLNDLRRAVLRMGKLLGQEAMYVRFEEPGIELLTVGPAEKDG